MKRGTLALAVPFLLLVLAPVAYLLAESLRLDDGGFGLATIGDMVLDLRQLGLLKTSVLLAGGTALACVATGVPLAFLITRTDLPWRRFFSAACLIPLLIPPYIHAIVWTKPLRSFLPDSFIFGLGGGIFVFTVSFFPFVAIITASGLKSVAPALEEAGVLARGPFATLKRITLPLATPHILAGATLVFVFTVINVEVPDILRIRAYPLEIFIQFSAFYDTQKATMLSAPLVLVTMVLVWSQMRHMAKGSYVLLGPGFARHGFFELGPWKLPGFLFAAVAAGVSAIAPLAALAAGAGSLETYENAFAQARDPILYSIFTAGIAAFFMVCFGVGVSYYTERHTGKLPRLVSYLSQVPFGIPPVVLGISLIGLWNRPGLDLVYETSAMLIIAYIAGYTPFVALILSSSLKQIPEELEEAGWLATKSRARIFYRILLPLMSPGMFVGFLAGFVLAVSNLGTALLTVAPGKTTLPISIYNYMHYGSDEMVCAMSLILVVLVIAGILLTILLGSCIRKGLGLV